MKASSNSWHVCDVAPDVTKSVGRATILLKYRRVIKKIWIYSLLFHILLSVSITWFSGTAEYISCQCEKILHEVLPGLCVTSLVPPAWLVAGQLSALAWSVWHSAPPQCRLSAERKKKEQMSHTVKRHAREGRHLSLHAMWSFIPRTLPHSSAVPSAQVFIAQQVTLSGSTQHEGVCGLNYKAVILYSIPVLAIAVVQ